MHAKEESWMSLNNPPMSPVGIVVEMSDRQLPVRMRLDALRSAVKTARPRMGIVRRVLAVPMALAVRVMSRNPGRIDLTLS